MITGKMDDHLGHNEPKANTDSMVLRCSVFAVEKLETWNMQGFILFKLQQVGSTPLTSKRTLGR